MTLFHDIVNHVNHGKIKKSFYIHSAGYIYLRLDGKYRAEHRILMERFMNRHLHRNEIVHHKNSDRKDNRLENLEIISRSRHTKLHWRIKTAVITRRQLPLFTETKPKQERLWA